MAVVSSTTPRPAPKWPPVTETASMVSWRSSSATCCTCSILSLRRSSGVLIVSRSGVLLNSVTAIFQFCMSEPGVRRELGFAHPARSEQPDWLALLATQFVQCDFHHLRRLPPVPVNFRELYE